MELKHILKEISKKTGNYTVYWNLITKYISNLASCAQKNFEPMQLNICM